MKTGKVFVRKAESQQFLDPCEHSRDRRLAPLKLDKQENEENHSLPGAQTQEKMSSTETRTTRGA